MDVNQIIAQFAAKFQDMVQSVSSQQAWQVASLSDGAAELHIETYPGNIRVCHIVNRLGTVSFFAPTNLSFDSLNEVPHQMSTLLLSRNDSRAIGFWCLEELAEKHTFTCMHMAKIQYMDADDLSKIVVNIVSECDSFEQSILNA